MNVFTTSLLYHFAAVQQLLSKYGVEANVSLSNGVLLVRGRNRYYRFYPQYLCDDGGRPRFSLEIEPRVRAFVGWRPYFNKRWPIATDKVAFKAYCDQQGLRTPAMWRKPAPGMRDFIVKRTALSFGKGIHGPFQTYDAANPAQAAGEDGFYETFIRGQIVKASYWNESLVALEVKPSPSVSGDGRRTLRELIAAILRPTTPKDEWQAYAEVAAYQNLELDSVPARGQSVLVDFRFGTYAEPLTLDNMNALRKAEGSALLRQLRDIGPALNRGIPEELRDCTLFSVDAMLDAEEQLWLLEMNCNPVCHPDCYDAMFHSLFGAPDATAPAPIPPQNALPPYRPVPHQAPAMAAPVFPPSGYPLAPDAPAELPVKRWLS